MYANTSRYLGRLPYIDGLRACAMFMVLFFHCSGYSQGAAEPSFLYAILNEGYLGVNLFLVLSGFCLYIPFLDPARSASTTLWTFAKRRARRIIPPYYAALIIFWIVLMADTLSGRHLQDDATTPAHVVKSLLWHLVLLHNLRPQYVLSINGPFWSLALEASLYVLFPLIVEAYRRFGPVVPALALLAVDLACRSALETTLPPETLSAGQQFVLYDSLWGRCFEFAAGMTAAHFVLIKRSRFAGNRGVLDAVALVVFLLTGGAAIFTAGRFGYLSVFPDALWGLCFSSLILLCAHDGKLQSIFSNRLLTSIGVFSYSIYLIHQPIVKVLDKISMAHHLFRIPVGFLWISAIVLVIGYAFHRLFELPFMKRAEPRPMPDAAIATS